MRISLLNGVINDLLNYLDYENPLWKFNIPKKLEVNLITGEIFYIDEDSFYKFYQENPECTTH